MSEAPVVENSFYEHDEYGLVKVIDITNGVVTMEKRDQEIWTGRQVIPGYSKQSAAGFLDDTEPADITIQGQPAVFNLRGLQQ